MTATRDRLLELLTDRALVGLGQREQIELAELLVQVQDVDVAAFDAAAAAVALASIGPLEPMPTDIENRIEARALQLLDGDGLRPATDYLRTRELDKLAPGFSATQVDPVIDVTPASESSDLDISKDFKRTHMMEERPSAAPASIPTLTRPGDRAPGAQISAPTPMLAYAPAPLAPPPAPAPPAPASVQPHAPFSQGQSSSPSFNPQSGSFAPPSHPSNVVAFPGPARASAPSRAIAIGGWIAAAACLLLAIGAFAMRRAAPGPVATNLPPPVPTSATAPLPVPTPAPSQTPAQLREQLLAQQGSARADWSPTKDPAGKTATGEVVWNKDQQRGTMRFRGLAKNDPKLAQYQLWIFDKTRDEKYPVDGGVFDVDSETGDVIVPIRATLPVATPTLFAVTLEKPGGVVVSKRERIVVVAKLGG